MGELQWRPLTAVEGLELLGGAGRFRLVERAPSGLAYLIHYPAGVSSPVHRHDHDSIVYLLSGQLRGTLDGVPVELRQGESVLHPLGVVHSVEAVEDSTWIEFKSPLPRRPPI